ncbi:anaerobic ribonucleoside-triphosphate reductase activating protein [Patescibacteria group bacterium]|nr:anaerobic ribonucleoside-triphosphate reductase activating protein [Patescibacteria group bacterium]
MIIGGLQKLTLIDYPGKLAATVFLAGCNFCCPWCYSSELVLPEKIKKQPKISEKEFFEFLEERKGLLKGVTVCGGEPTINKDLPNFAKEIKKLGYSVKLDTNGSNPTMLKKLIDNNLIDYVAMDVKLPKEKYSELYSKVENIEKSIKILKEDKIDCEFRTTVIPTVLEKKDILKIARWISPAKKYYLQNFRPEKTIDPKFKKIKPYSEKYLSEIKKAISPFFEVCQIR